VGCPGPGSEGAAAGAAASAAVDAAFAMGLGTAPTEQGPALASSGDQAEGGGALVTRPAPVGVGFMAAQEPWDAAAFIQRCHIDATQQRALQLPEWRGGEDDGGASVPLVDDTPDEYAQLPLQVRLCVHCRRRTASCRCWQCRC